MENPAKPGENQATRNELGQFIPGVSGNPAGKPKGVKHMTTLLEEAIKAVAEGTGTTEDKLVVKALIDKAKQGDTKAIDMVFDRLEGKPKQTTEIETDGAQILILPIELINKHEADTSTSDNSEGHSQVQSSELRPEIREDDPGSIGDGSGSSVQEQSESNLHSTDLPTGEGYSVGGTVEDSQTDSGEDKREPVGADGQN